MIELKTFLGNAVIHKTVLSKSRITIGRSEDNDLVLANPHVSRLEAVIEQTDDGHKLIDNSLNGILVDNQPITGSVDLPSSCRITIYPFEIQFESEADDETVTISLVQKDTAPAESHDMTAHASRPVAAHVAGLIGESPPMLKLYQLIQTVGNSRATILIRGEHGTGKELVARAMHEVSSRNQQVFIPVNCAAIPIDLIESELFGYENGPLPVPKIPKKAKLKKRREEQFS